MLIDNCVAPLAPPLLQRLLHLSCHPPPPRSTHAHTHTCAVHLCVYPVFRGDLADTLPAGLIVATQDATSATSYVIVVKSVSILTGGSACRDLCRDGGKKGNKKERKKKEKEKKTFPRSSPFDLSVAVGFFGEFIDDPYPFFAHARHAYAPTFLENRTLLQPASKSIGYFLGFRSSFLSRWMRSSKGDASGIRCTESSFFNCVDEFLSNLPGKPYDS